MTNAEVYLDSVKTRLTQDAAVGTQGPGGSARHIQGRSQGHHQVKQFCYCWKLHMWTD